MLKKKKFYLGAAQFGQEYGVTNTKQLDFAEIEKICSFALKNKIKDIDTSPMYNSSEKLIGSLSANFRLTTKIPTFNSSHLTYKSWIEKSIQTSLKNLKAQSLEGLLFHNMNDFNERFDKNCIAFIQSLKLSGVIKKVGFSIYDEVELINGVKKLIPDVIQVPYSIFDRRIESYPLITQLKENRTEIIGRSIFLQGLLVNPAFDYKNLFGKKSSVFKEWYMSCYQHRISPINACMSFILDSDFIDSFVVGASSKKDLSEITKAYSNDCMSNKIAFEQINDLSIIDPRNWPN